MDLFLVRHGESLKNQTGSFSSKLDDEALTFAGLGQARALAEAFSVWAGVPGRTVRSIYSADSARSQLTAERIAEDLHVPVTTYGALRSTFAGALAGRSESEALMTHPRYMRELSLYRLGLFNAYDLTVAEGKESKRQFEWRVAQCLDEILAVEGESVKIVVTHRSPATAILMRYARVLHGYPENFFGYVQLDLGRLTWLRGTSERVTEIRSVNIESSDLLA